MLKCKDCKLFKNRIDSKKANWCEKFKVIADPEQAFCEMGEMSLHKDISYTLWIARDQSGAVYIHTSKPRKNKHGWTSGCCPIGACNRDSFPEIKWEDEDPTEIDIIVKNNK